MDVDPMARRLMEDYSESCARRSGLPEGARTEARLELYSHVYDLAASKASEAGSGTILPDHARAAIAAVGTPESVDAAFFAPQRARQERAPFTPRAVAYVIDAVLLWIVFSFALGTLYAFLFMPFVWAGGPMADCDFGPFWSDCSYQGGRFFWMGPVFAVMGLVQFALVVLAFAAFEATTGQTPGKMALHLRTVSAEGGPVTWKAAILRNIAKGQPFLLLLDAALGHLAYEGSGERISDRFARTAVVREVQ